MTPWRSSPAQISRPAVELEVQRQPNQGPARRGPFSFEGDFVEGLYSQQQQADLAGLLAIISSSGAKTGSAHARRCCIWPPSPSRLFSRRSGDGCLNSFQHGSTALFVAPACCRFLSIRGCAPRAVSSGRCRTELGTGRVMRTTEHVWPVDIVCLVKRIAYSAIYTSGMWMPGAAARILASISAASSRTHARSAHWCHYCNLVRKGPSRAATVEVHVSGGPSDSSTRDLFFLSWDLPWVKGSDCG